MRGISLLLEKGDVKDDGNSLSRDPTPKLECLFSYSPSAREVAESPCMNSVLGECKRVLIVVQI